MAVVNSRRELLFQVGATALAAGAGAVLASPALAAEGGVASTDPFRFCLNTSTIRGANLTIVEEAEIAARTGYSAVEPWISEIAEYQKKGGSLPDLGKRIKDLGLTVEDAIGFDEWIVDDDARRAAGLEKIKQHMDMLVQIGGKRMAAPPIGANKAGDPLIELPKIAERYRAVLDLGEQMGIQPLVELWGSSKNLHLLSDVAYVAIAAGRPKASMLLDLYHLHRGGSDFEGLKLLNGAALHVIHTNDWPDRPVAELTDAQRIFPGDGAAPLTDIFRTLRDTGFHGFLSLELFNHDYWKRSPLKVAQEGIDKMRAAVHKSLA